MARYSDLCGCGHERLYHKGCVGDCCAKRDQCGCPSFRVAPPQYAAVERALVGIPVRRLGVRMKT